MRKNTPVVPFDQRSPRNGLLAAVACACACLAACGGGASDDGTTTTASAESAAIATGSTTLQIDTEALPAAAAALVAQPTFHTAPLLLDPPDDTDASNPAASAHAAPRKQRVPVASQTLSTRRLSLDKLEGALRGRPMSTPTPGAERSTAPAASSDDEPTATPLAGGSVVATYSPAQVRAAYGLPALPSRDAGLDAEQAAQLGAGQTIYIVNAMHDPNIVAELAAFNQKFGLPGCVTKAIGPTASLPLAAASSSGCEFSVVYSTAAGGMTTKAPAYESGWATEIALDVQWAHATAPLARLVLIESPDASLTSLLGGIKLANAMGPGVVSMSFGAPEGSYTAQVDSAFAGPGMSYLAATGDWGAGVYWPSVSPKVLAVGGTTLAYDGSGERRETAWSGTGGGMSAYAERPDYQSAAVPGLGTPARRTLADVAFNADPSSGQYVAMMSPGSSTVRWISVGGTSLSTPQWAGVVAIANAMRARSGQALLGQPHRALYGDIAAVPGSYAAGFADIVEGRHGTCATCAATAGHDPLTGLGTPQVGALLSALTGARAAPTAPVVTPATITGRVGTALSFTASARASHALAFSLSRAPAGMRIDSSTGAVTWPTPVAGTHAVDVTARDTVDGLSGTARYTVVVSPLAAPVVASADVSGRVGTPLTFSLAVTAANAVTRTLGPGAPKGLKIATNGVVSWAAPVAGRFEVTVIAKDKKTGLVGQGVATLTIAAANAPVVTGAGLRGQAGSAFTHQLQTTSDYPVGYSLSGAPKGMTVGKTGLVSWPRPVAGTYSFAVLAKDSRTGLVGRGSFTLEVSPAATAAGPVITAAAMTGVAGQPLTGTIRFEAPGATSLSVTIAGVPMGMMLSASGPTLTARWANPVQGRYSLTVTAVDSAKRTAQATVPITITAP